MALVIDPATGQLVDDGKPSTNQQLTALANNGTPGFQATLAAPPPPQMGLLARAGSGVSALANSSALQTAIAPVTAALGSSLGAAGVLAGNALSPLDAARRGLTNLVGGDVNTLPGGPNALSDIAYGAADKGFSVAGQAVDTAKSTISGGLRSALGVQAAPTPIAAPLSAAAPAVPSAVTPTQQPVSDVPAAVLPSVTKPAATAADLQGYNDQIASLLAKSGGGQTQAERGSYNDMNTPQAGGISGRGPGNNGINFGFGTGADGQAQSATQYLAQMRMQDQQNATATTRRNLQDDINNTLGGISRQSSIGDIVAAKAKLRTLGAQQAQEVDNQGKLGIANIEANTSASNRNAQLTAARLAAAASLQGQLQTANIKGQYGLQAAGIKADAANAKVQLGLHGPDARVKAAQADLLEQRSSLAGKLFASGQIDANQYAGMLKDGQVEAQKLAVDAITGGHISPERDSLLDQAAKLKAQQDLIAAQKKGK